MERDKKRGTRRSKTESVVKNRLEMCKRVYGEDEGYYASKPGRLKKNNTACSCWMCREGKKTRRPDK